MVTYTNMRQYRVHNPKVVLVVQVEVHPSALKRGLEADEVIRMWAARALTIRSSTMTSPRGGSGWHSMSREGRGSWLR